MELKAYLNGVEYRLTDRYVIREQVGQPGSSSLDIRLDGKPLPFTHTKVELKYLGALFYTGLISMVETPTYSSKYQTDIVPIQVSSIETIFNRRYALGVYKNKFTHEIVLDLFNNYLIEEGLTLGTIEEFDHRYDDYVIPNLKLGDVLRELGDIVGAVASITPSKVFNFTSKNLFPEISPPTHITKLKKSESGNDLKTIQKITGATASTSTQVESLTWANDQTSILLGYQIATEPSITINSISVDVGIIGVDEDNPSKTFLWALNNNAVVLNPNATILPVSGDTISVIFKGFFSVEVLADNEVLRTEISNISGTSGKIESVVVDTSITTQQDGESLGQSLLQEKSEREETITLECNDLSASNLLNAWPISYPDLNIEGVYIVTERTIQDFYDNVFKISLKLKNRGFYSRYGTVYNQNNKEINNLSVRTDNLIVTSSFIYETIDMEDEVEINQSFMELTPGTTDIFSPLFIDGITPSGGIS